MAGSILLKIRVVSLGSNGILLSILESVDLKSTIAGSRFLFTVHQLLLRKFQEFMSLKSVRTLHSGN